MSNQQNIIYQHRDKGEYKKSLELTINSLNKIEPGIYEKLLELSEKKAS